MSPLLDRSRSSADPHLLWRVRLMAIGAALGLGGMILDVSWLILVALVPLILGVGLRHLPSYGDDDESAD